MLELCVCVWQVGAVRMEWSPLVLRRGKVGKKNGQREEQSWERKETGCEGKGGHFDIQRDVRCPAWPFLRLVGPSALVYLAMPRVVLYLALGMSGHLWQAAAVQGCTLGIYEAAVC